MSDALEVLVPGPQTTVQDHGRRGHAHRGVAVAGTGFIGPVHVEAVRRLGHRVVGVLGSTPAKGCAAAAALGVPAAYDSLAERHKGAREEGAGEHGQQRPQAGKGRERGEQARESERVSG